jgi:hypothetical protein
MSAEATLILSRVVVANELAQQEEAHGDSKKKVKWYPPYKHGGPQAGRTPQAQRTRCKLGRPDARPPQAGSPAQAGSSQTGRSS